MIVKKHRLLMASLLTWSLLFSVPARGASRPFLYFVFSSDAHSAATVNEIAESSTTRYLQNIKGLSINRAGARRQALRIRFDPQRLTAYGLSMKDAEEALAQLRLQMQPRGKSLYERELLAASPSDFPPMQELESIFLKSVDGASIRLTDVAAIEIGLEDAAGRATYQGQQVVAFGVAIAADANRLGLLIPLNFALAQMRISLPVGLNLEMIPPKLLSLLAR